VTCWSQADSLLGLVVADTIGTFVDISTAPLIDAQALVIAALLAAVTYNIITWKFGLPSSSSNSLEEIIMKMA